MELSFFKYVRLWEKDRRVYPFDCTVLKAHFNPLKRDRYYSSKTTQYTSKFQAYRWSESCQNNSNALSIFCQSFCRWQRFMVFKTNLWNWKFQDPMKCLNFGGYSRLRFMIISVRNIGLLTSIILFY